VRSENYLLASGSFGRLSQSTSGKRLIGRSLKELLARAEGPRTTPHVGLTALRTGWAMLTLKRYSVCLLFLVVVGLLLPGSSQAYLDPGSGSSILQLTLAGLFAISFILKLGWSRLKSWVSRTRTPEKPKAES
jgi:hypothetical protein